MAIAYVPLTNDPRHVKIDARDRVLLQQYRWHIDYRGRIRSNLRGTRAIPQLELRHLLLPPRPGFSVGHRNGDRFDCRRRNLRYMSRSESVLRSPKKPQKRNQSGLVGVCTDAAGRYRASLMFRGVRYHLGRFSTAEEAAAAYSTARAALVKEP